ncbi:hypothetical protein C8F01DRAFT_1252056 [Mycena amicta]|nr:hypothetical protein C8F01DRAFT_1252056 [Mycena amicta]
MSIPMPWSPLKELKADAQDYTRGAEPFVLVASAISSVIFWFQLADVPVILLILTTTLRIATPGIYASVGLLLLPALLSLIKDLLKH